LSISPTDAYFISQSTQPILFIPSQDTTKAVYEDENGRNSF